MAKPQADELRLAGQGVPTGNCRKLYIAQFRC
jgi:hypothetical protein